MRAMIWLAVATLGAGLVTACKDAPTKENQENQAPAANFFSNCSALRCDFQDASSDADGNIASWNWSFGTAGSAEKNPFYVYSNAGSYPVSSSSARWNMSREVSRSGRVNRGRWCRPRK